MSAYSDAVLAIDSVLAPNYYKLDDAGATAVDSGGLNYGACSYNGSVTHSVTGILPGDAGTCAYQNKDTHLATRAHNLLLDEPSTNRGLASIVAWVRSVDTRINGASGGWGIVEKPNTIALRGRGSGFEAAVTGVGTLSSDQNLFVPNNTYCVATVIDCPSGTWSMVVNGVELETMTGIAPSTEVAWAAGQPLYIGGHAGFGASGLHGYEQHASMFWSHALDLSDIRNFVEIGFTELEESDTRANAFTWSREVVGANTARKRIRITNDSTSTVYLGIGRDAVVGGGIRLSPAGDYWESDTFTGEVNSIHNEGVGAKNLCIFEEE